MTFLMLLIILSIPFNVFAKVEPFAEFQKVKTFVTHAIFYPEIKKNMISKLPKDVNIILTVPKTLNKVSIKNEFLKIANTTNINMIELNGAMSEWSRDGLPYPAINDGKYFFIDSIYQYYEEDIKFAKFFNLPIVKSNIAFEGGNFLTDSKGNCFIVENEMTKRIQDITFQKFFGCSKMNRMPFIKGIGHIDESLKFLSPTEILTDLKEYKTILEKQNYKVTLLPRPSHEYGNYLNSVIVNNLIFVPVFNDKQDKVAIDLYKKFNFEIIPIDSRKLLDHAGLLHCTTMTYPF